jgi:hypothetical protein
MRINKIYIALGVLIAAALFLELTAHADEVNETTTITFSAPVQIPGQVLPAGSYVFEQADPNGDQNLIRVSNVDRTRLYATLETVSAYRKEPGDTAIVLAQPENGKPALVKWFYPGRSNGHEFLYSKQQEQQIATGMLETFIGDHVLSNSAAAGN